MVERETFHGFNECGQSDGAFLPQKTRQRTRDHHDGRKLVEEVQGNTIIIYAENPKEAIELLRHGFLEWLINRHTKPYRQLINKLITLFEDLQYENKEKTIETLERLL